ncbi:hypothetical protein [Rhodococcus opacus]|uniref:hypothetical protein n=1 Tax=Rhodococcus opacus TaxID=37919 RepID=UPI002236A5B9|nr:hypothetical protein [Rhodococcus opacus]UZG59620.1 hypothetical protein ONE62_38220 [Rhodococcus opacus]
MNADQHGALERVRDACAVLRTFMHAQHTGVSALVWYDTYRQLTGDLMDAVLGARTAGIPEHIIYDST